MPDSAKGLADQTSIALVTGASSGIGKAVAEALLKEGHTVYGTSRNPEGAGLNPGVQWLAFEGAQPGTVADFTSAHADLLSNIDILVNNAGSGRFGEVLKHSESVLNEQIQLLLEAPMALTRAVLPGMRSRRRGVIVNVSSLAAELPLPYMAAYSAAKAGLSAFTRSLVLTEGHSGVRLIDFQLGDYQTAFNEAMACVPDLTESEKRVWEQFDKHLRESPLPELAARDLLKALKAGRSGTIRSGSFFQARLAPLGLRFLPRSCLFGLIRRYHGIAGK